MSSTLSDKLLSCREDLQLSRRKWSQALQSALLDQGPNGFMSLEKDDQDALKKKPSAGDQVRGNAELLKTAIIAKVMVYGFLYSIFNSLN